MACSVTLEDILRSQLEDGNTISACEEIKKEEYQEWIVEHGWDKLVPVIIAQLSQENWEKCPQVLRGCQELLCHVAKVGKPKEVLISLSEHCEAFQDDVKYRHILPAIATSFETWGINVAASRVWEWILETLVSHLHALKVPEPPILEGKERLLLDGDENQVNLCQTVQAFVELLQRLSALIKILSNKEKDKAAGDNIDDDEKIAATKCRGHLTKSALQVLSRPLAYLHLGVARESASVSTCRQIAENLVDTIKENVPNPITLINFSTIQRLFNLDPIKEKDYDHGSEIRWSRGIGILFFIIFDKPENRSYVPSCYSPIYLFNQLVGNINLMMMDDESYLLHLKALILAKFLMTGIPKSSLSADILDIGTQTQFLKAIYKAIVYHSSAEIRKLAFENFQLYFSLFTIRARYRLVTLIFNVCNHSGLIGYTITQVKDIIVSSLNKSDLPEEFRGHSLQVMVRQFCRLKHKEETDLLEVSDEVMASLNFLICLFLRDKANETEIHDLSNELQENFLKQIEKGLVLMRARYQSQLNDCKNPNSDQSLFTETTLTIGGRVLPILNREQMAGVLNSALSTFDMMNCVLIQLTDVLQKMNSEK